MKKRIRKDLKELQFVIDRYGVMEKNYFDKYEEALEEGLIEGLKLIEL